MFVDDIEKQIAKLAIEENLYILMAFHMAEKNAYSKLADTYLQQAHALCHEQNKLRHLQVRLSDND